MKKERGLGSDGLRLLGVETSSPIFSVAVCDGERISAALQMEGLGRPSDFLTDLIEKALSSSGLELAHVDGFAISVGPGSFTGLRVGVTTVKTLAWALKKPVMPVSSLEVIAQNFTGSSDPVALFLDARKGKIYTALFASDGARGIKRLSEDHLVLPEEFLKKLSPKTVLAGDGIRRYSELIASIGSNKFIRAPEAQWIPLAEALCRLAASRWPAGILDDPHRLVPQYLYSKESDITGW